MDNIPNNKQELNILQPLSVKSSDKSFQQKAEEQETKRRQENAKKAKEAADQLFPNEKWEKLEDGIYKAGKKRSLDEMNDARILRNLGSTIYLVPENTRAIGRKYDAIVNGLQFEFKNIGGNQNTLIEHFLKSRSQAQNVFINLETSNLTRREVLGALYNARNRVTHTNNKGIVIKGYAERNKFSGGRIILKVKDRERLIYLNVDDLKAR